MATSTGGAFAVCCWSTRYVRDSKFYISIVLGWDYDSECSDRGRVLAKAQKPQRGYRINQSINQPINQSIN